MSSQGDRFEEIQLGRKTLIVDRSRPIKRGHQRTVFPAFASERGAKNGRRVRRFVPAFRFEDEVQR